MSTAPAPIRHRRAPERLTQFLLVTLVALVGIAVILLARNEWGSGSSSTVHGSGVAATDTRTLPAFSSIDLAGDNRMTVQVGEEQKVVVHGDDNLIDNITTEVRSGELVVSDTGSYSAKSPMVVDVTVPELRSVTLSGSGILSIEGIRAADFAVDAPGSGILSVSGTTARLDASLQGSGDLQLQELVAQDARASLSGTGRLQVHATRTLDASVSGSGAIFYSGSPDVTRSVSGSGVIIGR